MTEITKAAKELVQPAEMEQEPLEVSGLQPPFSGLELCLRQILRRVSDLNYLTCRHLRAIFHEEKSLNLVILAITEVARGCHRLGLRPPTESIRKRDLPGLLQQISTWTRAVNYLPPQQIYLPFYRQHRSTPEPGVQANAGQQNEPRIS